MKALYTKINEKYYKINEASVTPRMAVRASETNVNSVVDERLKQANLNIFLNLLDAETAKTNKELYEEMIQKLTEDKTTEIAPLENKYKLYIDYTVLDAERKEVEHSVVIKPVTFNDLMFTLGVNVDNECLYRSVRGCKSTVSFDMKTTVPFGIVDRKQTNCTLIINDMSIYQALYLTEEEHESIYSNPFKWGSETVESSLETMIRVFSTSQEGIDINALHLHFIPRKVTVSTDIILPNYIVVYDQNTVDTVLTENKQTL